MYKKLISILLAFTLLTQIVGCYSYQEITREEFSQAEEYLDLKVRTADQYTYEFYENDYTVKEDSIYGSGRKIFMPGSWDEDDEDFMGSIPLKDIELFKFDKFNTVLTIGAIIGLGVVGGIGYMIGYELANFKIGPLNIPPPRF